MITSDLVEWMNGNWGPLERCQPKQMSTAMGFFCLRCLPEERFDGDFTLKQWVAEAFPLAISDVLVGHLLKQNNSEKISDHVVAGHLLKQNNSETV
uniref:Uncharacterized protein n=1 Tax=Nymphaea colorata TaxID=210225 RepID=A0A5K0Y6E5_9MAGN